MSLEELRENNKNLVVKKALECFRENGIEKTKIKDVANAAGLTERSVYRYFETKADLVLAAAYLFWSITTDRANMAVMENGVQKLSGVEQIRIMLYHYANMIFEDPKGVRFILDAELALCSAGKNHQVVNRPPVKFEISTSPLACAIRKGLKDGSVDPNVDIKELYYNAYDSILGVMQRLALDTTSATDVDNEKRMKHLCDMLVREFGGNKAPEGANLQH